MKEDGGDRSACDGGAVAQVCSAVIHQFVDAAAEILDVYYHLSVSQSGPQQQRLAEAEAADFPADVLVARHNHLSTALHQLRQISDRQSHRTAVCVGFGNEVDGESAKKSFAGAALDQIDALRQRQTICCRRSAPVHSRHLVGGDYVTQIVLRTVHTSEINRARQLYKNISMLFLFPVSLVQASLQYLMHHVTVSLQQSQITFYKTIV